MWANVPCFPQNPKWFQSIITGSPSSSQRKKWTASQQHRVLCSIWGSIHLTNHPSTGPAQSPSIHPSTHTPHILPLTHTHTPIKLLVTQLALNRSIFDSSGSFDRLEPPISVNRRWRRSRPLWSQKYLATLRLWSPSPASIARKSHSNTGHD